MPEFLLAAAGFVLAMVALGLFRLLRGPSDADRLMAVDERGQVINIVAEVNHVSAVGI